MKKLFGKLGIVVLLLACGFIIISALMYPKPASADSGMTTVASRGNVVVYKTNDSGTVIYVAYNTNTGDVSISTR